MGRNVVLIVLMVLALTAEGCMVVASPVLGVIYTEAKYGDTATGETGANKEGRACARSILGLVAEGDASIAAAKANGGITQVSSVDHSAKNLVGIMGEWCTVVKGR
jgi:hypothetical protein